MNAEPRQPSTTRHHFRLAELLKSAVPDPQPPRVLSEAEQRSLHVWVIEDADLRFRMS